MIKNTHVFLAAATIVSCLATPVTLAGGKTSDLFKDLQQNKGIMLPFKSVDNAEVILFKGHESNLNLPSGTRHAFGENFTLQGEFEGQRACVVYTESPTSSDMKFMFDKNGKEALVFLSEEYMAHISTHEVSHCLSHDFANSNYEINSLLNSKEFSNIKMQVRTLDLAIRETHADLLSTLIGASKTGSWSTVGNVILPLRSAKLYPRHSTLSAVYAIIEKIDPIDLYGKKQSQVTELGNLLFKKEFFNGDSISLKSPGVYSILQDWSASGREMKYVSEKLRTPDAIKGSRIIIPYLELAESILGKNSFYDEAHANRFYNLKKLALHQQYTMTNDYQNKFRSIGFAEELKSNIKKELMFLEVLTAETYQASNVNKNYTLRSDLLESVRLADHSKPLIGTRKREESKEMTIKI